MNKEEIQAYIGLRMRPGSLDVYQAMLGLSPGKTLSAAEKLINEMPKSSAAKVDYEAFAKTIPLDDVVLAVDIEMNDALSDPKKSVKSPLGWVVSQFLRTSFGMRVACSFMGIDYATIRSYVQQGNIQALLELNQIWVLAGFTHLLDGKTLSSEFDAWMGL